MNWHNLLYFSKGERRALTVLLCLITASWIILLLTDDKPMPVAPEANAYRVANRLASDSGRITTLSPTPTKKATTPKGKASTFTHNTRYPIGKKKSGYTPYPRTEKYPPGTLVELNAADTTTLKKVPGIGSAFARRIVKYRELLGGFYTVDQLSEVYGIDEERYAALEPWFTVDTSQVRRLAVNRIPADSLNRHPYISYRQARTIGQLRKQKSRLSGWENLQLIEEFTALDRERLAPYLSFE